MRAVMENMLETDSDVASIDTDTEKERTEGDGRESELLVDSSNNQPGDSKTLTNADDTGAQKADILGTANGASAVVFNRESSSSSMSSTSKQVSAGPGTPVSCDPNLSCVLKTTLTELDASILTQSTKSSAAASPKELPPRNQLIQLKPTMCKPKLSSKNGSESSPDGLNKQKNPKFVPYEPYKGAVRPITEDGNRTRKLHSRTASDTSASSSCFEYATDKTKSREEDLAAHQFSVAQTSSENTQVKSIKDHRRTIENEECAESCIHKQKLTMQKQTNALTFVKEQLKIAEKDNHDLHKENIRLKKLLVDSLSGDVFQSKVGYDHDPPGNISAANESVDALSNEIEVWRSKFLSSCVLVDQLTRENGTLHETVGSSTSIFRDLKLNGCIPPEHFDRINGWLQNSRTSPQPNESISNEESYST